MKPKINLAELFDRIVQVNAEVIKGHYKPEAIHAAKEKLKLWLESLGLEVEV